MMTRAAGGVMSAGATHASTASIEERAQPHATSSARSDSSAPKKALPAMSVSGRLPERTNRTAIEIDAVRTEPTCQIRGGRGG